MDLVSVVVPAAECVEADLGDLADLEEVDLVVLVDAGLVVDLVVLLAVDLAVLAAVVVALLAVALAVLRPVGWRRDLVLGRTSTSLRVEVRADLDCAAGAAVSD